MLASMKKLKPKNFREKGDKAITRVLIGTKYHLAREGKQKQNIENPF